MTGLQLRLRRILSPADGRGVVIPIDHGLTMGPIDGLEDPTRAIAQIAQGGADAVICHKGILRSGLPSLQLGRSTGVLIHLSASTTLGPDPHGKVLVGTVEECVRAGADGVSVHLNVGAATEPEQFAAVGILQGECAAWGMPLLAMMYPRGPTVRDPFAVEVVEHAARIGAELGASVVKTVYTGDPESFRRVVRGCPVPVLVAGGPKAESDEQVLTMVQGALEAGAAGVSIGRNVFGHVDPAAMTAALVSLVHGRIPMTDVLGQLRAARGR